MRRLFMIHVIDIVSSLAKAEFRRLMPVYEQFMAILESVSC